MEFSYLSLLKITLWCLFLHGKISVSGQPTSEGFLNIDCGISSGYSFVDKDTNLEYVSDDQFIDTGIKYNISGIYRTTSVAVQNYNVRSFPNGDRNCYTLKPVVLNNKYLIRANFMYGNYDGKNSAQDKNPILFDLHIGVNFWEKVNVSNAGAWYAYEVITVASGDFIQVCLINTNTGTPFISSLEMRPLGSNLYHAANASQSLVLSYRGNLAPNTTRMLRYPGDPHDRFWYTLNYDYYNWTTISTTSTVINSPNDPFEPPSFILQTATTPVNGTPLALHFNLEGAAADLQYYCILYFAEIEALAKDSKREFNVYINDEPLLGPYSPSYLRSDNVYWISHVNKDSQFGFVMNATLKSTLPPLLSALEYYSLVFLTNTATHAEDVEGIVAIRKQYQLLQRNWTGDPCGPEKYVWVGVTCSYTASAPRITALNLSSSGLTGYISPSFSNLTAIHSLDLSYNKLNGTIPEFLANLLSLQLLDLTGNCFTKPIPDVLLKKSDAGLLTLRIDSNANTCGNGFTSETTIKKKLTTPVIVIISVVLVALLALAVAVYIMLRSKRRKQGLVTDAVRPHVEEVPVRKMDFEDRKVQLDSKQFTYLQLESITNKFTRVIGQGGFGTVYHGYLEDSTEVAVKLLSGWSSQGMKEFLAETQNLEKVHHKNLISLVGYSNDGEHMALIYEYLPQGSLHDHLRGKTGLARPLSWRERLQIVVEAAQGLDYLHKGCQVPVIHRDVKPSNILLGQHLEAKIADFGLSKAVLSDAQYVSTVALVGTPGYMDPEYHRTLRLSEKSDVYSFGVVLLEIITGEPPIVQSAEKAHILERVKPMIDRGDIDGIVDRSLQGKCNINSVWKVLELAIMCTADYSARRPTMADVVIHLKESLKLETSCIRSENLYSEGTSISEKIAFGDISGTFGPSAR